MFKQFSKRYRRQILDYSVISMMKSAWIVFVVQIVPVTCRLMSVRSLAEKFHHNISQLPDTGAVIIWQILENSDTFQPQIYKSNIPKFNSDKAYLILTQSEPKQIRTLYWIGSTASLVAKKRAAKYALHLYSTLRGFLKNRAIVSIHREEEFMESKFFQNAINFVDQTSEIAPHRPRYYYKSDEEMLLYKLPNMYIARGKSAAHVKAVPLGTRWFINDVCIILETGYMAEKLNSVTTYGGPSASEKTLSSTMRVSSVISLIYSRAGTKPLKTCNPMFKAFIEVLENRDYYRFHEMDDSDDHLKDAETFVANRNRSVSFYKIVQSKMTIVDPRPILFLSCYYNDIEVYHKKACYLLDTASVAGLFFQMHAQTAFEDRLRALKMVEEYQHNKYSLASRPTRVRITEINQPSIMPVNLTINLGNFPIAEFNEGDDNNRDDE